VRECDFLGYESRTHANLLREEVVQISGEEAGKEEAITR